MSGIDALVVDALDAAASETFLKALGVDDVVSVRAAEEPSNGFRGYTLSLVVSQPGNADTLLEAALSAGASVLKPASKSFWGYGGVVQAPDGAIWKVACSAKKDSGPVTRAYDSLALLLGVDDVKASKRFYADRGLTVAKSFGSKYVEFEAGAGRVTLALYGRRALAKDAGIPPEGSGSHGISIASDLGTFTDPHGFIWT